MDFIEFTTRSIEKLLIPIKSRLLKGIVPSLFYLGTIVTLIKQLSPTTQIVWDTV
jgi:hydroxymethylpyrimidine/phosphomethylpyrimidine kinase